MQRSRQFAVVAGVSALLLLGTAGPALAAPSGPDATQELVEQEASALSVSSSVLWWSGGGLGVLLAGLVAGRRPSSSR